MKRAPTAEEMLVKMAGLCAGAEQCSSDIRNKILKKGFSAEQAAQMVAYLQQNKYLDDARFSRAFAVDKVRFSGWGRMKIRMGLRAKGMPDSIITQALEYIPEKDYGDALEKALFTKSRSLDLEDVNDRRKLYRHLASRGFESQLIVTALRKCLAKKNEG